MRIGSLSVSPVVLAPMAAVTDLPFRTVCEELGVGLTITEFLSANALTEGAKKAIDKMTPSLDGRPFGVQIFGREPERLAQAAVLAVEIGAFLVDINMGCPAKRVVAGACGSALMREPQLAQAMVRAVRAAVPAHLPVTVKHRAGWDERHLNAPEFALALVEAGAQMITVHGRTRTQGFSGRSDRGIIKKVREALPDEIPVVGNGDVVTVDDYFRMRDETGCDAVMIGRGAAIEALPDPAEQPRIAKCAATTPTPIERLRVFRRHADLIAAHAPTKKLVHELRKAVAWYSKGLRDSAHIREAAFSTLDPTQVRKIADGYFSSLLPEEKVQRDPHSVVDKTLGKVA
jgi:nifR3 family TIM-barrel protein